MEDWEQRIHSILGDDSERTPDNARRYMEHLRRILKLPVKVTGREDFPWEEPYVVGGWSQAEYRKLKKTNPSYTDKFELLEIAEPDPDELNDELVAKIRRISDGQEFSFGLSWLRCVGRKAEASKALDDYATWHADF